MRWEDRLLVYYVLLFATFFGLWLEKLGAILGEIGVWMATIGFFGLVIVSIYDLYRKFKSTNDKRVKKDTHETSLKKLDQMIGGFLFSFFVMIIVSFPLVISLIGGVPETDLTWILLIAVEAVLFFVANTYTYRHFANKYIRKGMRISYVVFVAFVVVMLAVILLL